MNGRVTALQQRDGNNVNDTTKGTAQDTGKDMAAEAYLSRLA